MPAWSETPSWLKKDEENPVEPEPTSSNTNGSLDKAPDTEKDTNSDETSARGCSTLLFGISLLFFAAFVYSTVVQNNDVDMLLWSIFYGLHAGVVFLSMVYFKCPISKLEKLIYFLSAGIAVWSTVYVVLISLKLANSVEEGGEKEEYIYELAGASIGLFSALYHGAVVRCCVKTKN